jgi:hypothetical protein
VAGHRATCATYSRKAQVKLPSLDEYERKIVPLVNTGAPEIVANTLMNEAL